MRLTTGTGLALLAGAICAYPFLQRASALEPSAHAAQALPTAIEASMATAAVAMAQTPPAPTIVWYSVTSEKQGLYGISGEWVVSQVWRAWSDGRVEVRHLRRQLSGYSGSGFDTWCNAETSYCSTPWVVVSDASNGYSFRSDINFDNQVDGADLASVLTDWGASPRFDIAPSTCPLNLVNPR
jgi:hypothetical protein